RLAEKEALLRLGQIHAAAAQLAGDRRVVPGGVVAQERELEALLPGRGAVAGPGVAAEPRQLRQDVVGEIDAGLLLGRGSGSDQQQDEDQGPFHLPYFSSCFRMAACPSSLPYFRSSTRPRIAAYCFFSSSFVPT